MEKRSDPTAAAGMRSDGAAAPPAAAVLAAAAPPPPPPSKRDRHVVTWTPQEDDLLRDRVSIDGTDSWTSIAAKFKNKTGRQCRRRWYTYLNSECKKGGWSQEEDMILCEAQKVFGNRWTEIAKVVSGRTDNAVKNRFSTLCKKRAKHEASSKENIGSYVNPNNKRVVAQKGCIADGIAEPLAPSKQMRHHISDLSENHNPSERMIRQHGRQEEQLRPPLAVLAQNFNSVGGLKAQIPVNNNAKAAVYGVPNNMILSTFLKRDDPKLAALLRQADLLSSLAEKVNTENTNQSLEDAWKELQDYLIKTEESESLRSKISGMDFLLDDFKDLIEDLKSHNTGNRPPWSEHDLHEESQGSSAYSIGSFQHMDTRGNKNDQRQTEDCSSNHDAEVSSFLEDVLDPRIGGQAAALPFSEEPKDNDGNICVLPSSEFRSPLQTVPLFRSLAEGIPSPKFSASERQFLLDVFGLSSPASNPDSIQQPSCKRALLDRL